jgi:hypothetical protein
LFPHSSEFLQESPGIMLYNRPHINHSQTHCRSIENHFPRDRSPTCNLNF